MAATGSEISEATELLYLDLMKQCLTRSLFPEARRPLALSPRVRSRRAAWAIYKFFQPLLAALYLEPTLAFNRRERAEGKDWPVDAETMIGLARLQNLQDCAVDVLRRRIPGDFVETGAWRGGACIFMRAILKAYGNREKIVWVADSFQGLPEPDGRYAQDAKDFHWQLGDVLAVSLEEVKANFARYGLLDRQVEFLPGWFKDTLPSAPIERISVLRLDGDMYGSTMDALVALYPKLSSGGYAIVDDYGVLESCRQAVDDFRRGHGIDEPMQKIDGSGVFWEKR